jgi:hypothetical protein
VLLYDVGHDALGGYRGPVDVSVVAVGISFVNHAQHPVGSSFAPRPLDVLDKLFAFTRPALKPGVGRIDAGSVSGPHPVSPIAVTALAPQRLSRRLALSGVLDLGRLVKPFNRG